MRSWKSEVNRNLRVRLSLLTNGTSVRAIVFESFTADCDLQISRSRGTLVVTIILAVGIVYNI